MKLKKTKLIEEALCVYNEKHSKDKAPPVRKTDELCEKSDVTYQLEERMTDPVEIVPAASDKSDPIISNATHVPWIEHSMLIKIASALSVDNDKYRLSRLIKGSDLYFEPKPPAPPKTKEFLASMEKLRVQSEQAAYESLITRNDITIGDLAQGKELSVGQQVKETKEQLATIVNIFVSVVSVGYAFWYWSGTSMRLSLAGRTLLAIFGALLVLVAEVVVYLSYKNKVLTARAVENNKKVVNHVANTFSIGPAIAEKTERFGGTDIAKDSNLSTQGSLRKRRT